MTESNGRRDTSQVCTPNSVEYWEAVCESVEKVTLLVIPPRSNEAYAWNARAVELFSNGAIPQIFSCVQHPATIQLTDILSSLKGSGLHLSETYSVTSWRPTRTLISYSYSSETSG